MWELIIQWSLTSSDLVTSILLEKAEAGERNEEGNLVYLSIPSGFIAEVQSPLCIEDSLGPTYHIL